MDEDLKTSLDALRKTNEKLVSQQTYWHSLARGIMSGVGATVGAAVVIALAAAFLHQLSSIDLFKPTVEKILPYVDQSQQLSPTYEGPTTVEDPQPTGLPTTESSPSPE